jgi:hypothetical protein
MRRPSRSTTRSVRTPSWGFALVSVVLLTTACIDSSTTIAPIEVNVAPSTGSDPGPSIIAPAGQVTETPGNVYGGVSQFLGASDAVGNGDAGNGRGVKETSGLTAAQCAAKKGCRMTPGQRQTDANRNKLVNDVLQNGGGTTIRLEGTVDNQKQNISGKESIDLARNRAKASAALLKQQIEEDAKAKGQKVTVRVGQATLAGGVDCTAQGVVCITTGVHPVVQKKCAGRDSCATGGPPGTRDRTAIATATFHSGTGIQCVNPPCDTTTTVPGGSRDTTGGNTGGNTGIDPSRGIFGPGNGSNGGSSGTPGSSGSPDPSSPFDDSSTYCDLYEDECFDADDVADRVTVRVVVSSPDVFRVGGTLREQDVVVEEVVLYCDGAPCATGAVNIESFSGILSLPSTNANYRLCATPRSSNCEYYVASSSVPRSNLSGSSLNGGLLRAGFLSPTPSSIGNSAKVRPTLTVNDLTVSVSYPVWEGGEGCDAAVAPRSCWSWEEEDTIDMRAAVTVVGPNGSRFTRNGDAHHVDRIVVGTVGS